VALDLYRLHVRPAGDAAAAFTYCVDNGVLGTGWGTHWGDLPAPAETDWEDYLGKAREIWPERAFGPVRWLHDAPVGSLVWTRDTAGIYYLARLTGEWEYRDSPENRGLDISNVRAAKIVAIPGAEGAVPGAVVRSFAGRGQAFRRVLDDGAAQYSEYLFAKLASEALPAWRPSVAEVLGSLLGPLDVQDLVAAYLQAERRYVALPARHSDSTIAYEYILRDPSDGSAVAVQVKTGGQEVDVASLSNALGLRWIIVNTGRPYPPTLPSYVEALDPGELLRFLCARPNVLPLVADFWLSFVEEETGADP
jgi:hypothetical protein